MLSALTLYSALYKLYFKTEKIYIQNKHQKNKRKRKSNSAILHINRVKFKKCT